MTEPAENRHPVDGILKAEAMPSYWCSGCGIGTVFNTFIQTAAKIRLNPGIIGVVSGLGCTGKIATYLNCKSFQVNEGSIIDFAVKLDIEKVIVFLNDADFIASPETSLVPAAKKGKDVIIVYINNFIYQVFIEQKCLASTPFLGEPADRKIESPFNFPHLAELSGARYVCRWTALHVRRLMHSMSDALTKRGLSAIEVIAPCLMYYASSGQQGKKIERMKYLSDRAEIKHQEPTVNLAIRPAEKIIVGKFVDRA